MTIHRLSKRKELAREASISAFWSFSADRALLQESERQCQIRDGVPAELFLAMEITFDLEERSLKQLLNASMSTLEKRRRMNRPLDRIASERIDRIAVICGLAEEVFESRNVAACWMSQPNKALGGEQPIMVCATEIGGRQVRRMLIALEWGGAA